MSDDDHPTAVWTAYHFSQTNPAGPDQDNVPALLGRVAETIVGHGEVRIVDLVMHDEVTADGNWPSITVYYQTKDS